MKPKVRFDVAVGPTQDLGLRVSVASLARVIFKTPDDHEWILALERKATLVEKENRSIVEVNAQPFGGAVQILDLKALHDNVGAFHFDSERSRDEGDFRLFIKPSVWPTLLGFLIEQLSRLKDPVFETGPNRELAEEFEDAMNIKLTPNQLTSKPVGIVIEENPGPTKNYRARGFPTVRVYQIYESTISDLSLVDEIIASSTRFSDKDLSDLAMHDARNGGKGRANGILAFPMEEINGFYSGIPLTKRDFPVLFKGHRMAETVGIIIEGIDVPKYHKYRE